MFSRQNSFLMLVAGLGVLIAVGGVYYSVNNEAREAIDAGEPGPVVCESQVQTAAQSVDGYHRVDDRLAVGSDTVARTDKPDNIAIIPPVKVSRVAHAPAPHPIYVRPVRIKPVKMPRVPKVRLPRLPRRLPI